MLSTRLIKLILIFIMLGLMGYLVNDARGLSCDKCSVTLKNTQQQGVGVMSEIRYNMSDLFEQSKGGSCPVIWDRTLGYVKN